MAPKKINIEEKKKLILETAIIVFAEKGIHRTKMADISNKAGFSYGIMYNYFKNQEELLLETYIFLYSKLMEDFKDKFKILNNAKKTIVSIANIFTDSLSRLDHKIAMLFMDFWVEGIRGHKNYNEFLNNNFLEFKTMLSGVITEGIKNGELINHEAEMSAITIMAILDGNQLYHMTLNKNFDFKKQILFSIQLVLDGLTKESE